MVESQIGENRTDNLLIDNEHIPVSVAINDNLTLEPTFLEHKDPEVLIRLFVEDLVKRQKNIEKKVKEMYPEPSDFDYLPKNTQVHWREWISQVPVFGFNSSKYDLN